MPVSYLLNSYINIPWISGLDVSSDAVLVEVSDELYFYALNDLFTSLTEDDLKLYAFTNTLMERVWSYLPFGFRQQLQYIENKNDTIYTEIDCVELALKLGKEEIHSVYIGEYTKMVLDNRFQLTALENKVSNSFQRLLLSATWLTTDLADTVSALVKDLNLYFSPIKATLRQTPGITGADQSLVSLCLELHRQNHMREKDKLGENLTVVDMDWTSTDMFYDASLNTLGKHSYMYLVLFVCLLIKKICR